MALVVLGPCRSEACLKAVDMKRFLAGMMVGLLALGAGPLTSPVQASGVMVWPVQAKAASPARTLAPLLQTARLMEILAEEGRVHGDDLAADLLDRASTARWAGMIAAIHAPDRLGAIFDAALDEALTGQQTALRDAEVFFASPIGMRVVDLELSARAALVDPDLADAAALAFQRLQETSDSRVRQIDRFVEVNDLIEANVAGGMNASFAFLRGISEANTDPGGLDEAGILADLWSQEDDIRAETEEWLLPYLALAYRPLPDADLAAYIDFSAGPSGQVLNRALLSAFDALFVEISYDIGRAAARLMVGSDL